MRDGQRMREQIELRLDNRQIVSFVIGSLVVLGVVFALGVLVGKQLAAGNAQAPRPADPLAAIDAREQQRAAAAELDAGAGAAQAENLTFAQELTKPRPVAAAIEPTRAEASSGKPPKADPVAAKASGAAAEQAIGAKPASEGTDAVQAAPAPSASPGAAAATGAAAPAAGAPAAASPSGSPAAKAAAASPDATAGSGTAPATRPKESLAAAYDKAAGADSSHGGGAWCLQVASFPHKSEASKEAKKVSSKGYRARVEEAELSGKGRVFRVRVGSYDTRSQAEHAIDAFKRKTGKAAIVTSCR